MYKVKPELKLTFRFLFQHSHSKAISGEGMEIYFDSQYNGWPRGFRQHPITERSQVWSEKKPRNVHQQPCIMSNRPWDGPWVPGAPLSSSSWMVNTLIYTVYPSNPTNEKWRVIGAFIFQVLRNIKCTTWSKSIGTYSFQLQARLMENKSIPGEQTSAC